MMDLGEQLQNLLDLQDETQKAENLYVEIASRFHQLVLKRANLLEDLTKDKSIKELLQEYDIEVSSDTIKQWERIIQGRKK